MTSQIPLAFLLNIFTPFAIGFVALYLGAMGFSRGGIPWTKNKKITGKAARIIGSFCLLLSLGFVAVGVWFLAPLFR